MKQAELDAATNVVRDAIAQKMNEAGMSQFIPEIEKRLGQLRDIVQYGLQAAEDVRKREAKKTK
jgi:hypothetical protein